jgi:hypothetical protein
MGKDDAELCDDGSDGAHPMMGGGGRRSYIPGAAGQHLLMREKPPKRTLLEKAEALLLE